MLGYCFLNICCTLQGLKVLPFLVIVPGTSIGAALDLLSSEGQIALVLFSS